MNKCFLVATGILLCLCIFILTGCEENDINEPEAVPAQEENSEQPAITNVQENAESIDVTGTWSFIPGGTYALSQVANTRIEGTTVPSSPGSLSGSIEGSEIQLRSDNGMDNGDPGVLYSGTVNGDVMRGTATYELPFVSVPDGNPQFVTNDWVAVRL